ncbi:type I phosphomannose isomerase catalytic subunit, partial [Streptomyces glaucescens]|uniref:type I phosphomannose isomerase catalytic subunit n=2 Tax=Streptomyces TaxID=1883 RepID=UPI0030DC47E5
MDRLINTVRPYPWGSPTALPALMGTTPDGSPQAELWMGAHPGAPSRVQREGRPRGLDRIIEEDPRGELGDTVVRRFGPR